MNTKLIKKTKAVARQKFYTDSAVLRGIVGDPSRQMSNPHIRITQQERDEIIARLSHAERLSEALAETCGDLAEISLWINGNEPDREKLDHIPYWLNKHVEQRKSAISEWEALADYDASHLNK